MTDDGYSLERNGSVEDLRKLGLTLEESIGMRFTFYMEDADDEGNPDDIMFNGTVMNDPKWGYLAVHDKPKLIYWRSQVED